MVPLILFQLLFSIIHTIYIPNFNFKSTIFVNSTDKGYDQCRFFKIKNNGIYRMGQSNIINKWDVYNSSYYAEQKKFYSPEWFPNITNLGLSWQTNQITAPYWNSSKFDIISSIDLSVIKSQPQINTTYTLKGIGTTNNYYYMLFSYRTNFTNFLDIYHKNMTLAGGYVNLVNNQPNITISRDNNNIVIWTNTSDMNFGQIQPGSNINFFYNDHTSSPYLRNHTLNDIEFSLDGKYAVFQYDDKSKLTVLDLTLQTVAKTKNFTSIINQVLFLDSGTLLGVFLNYTHMEIYDISTLTLQKSVLFNALSNYSAIHYESQTIYQCLKGNISAIQMTCPALTYYNLSTFSCVDCNMPQHCTQCDATTGQCTACQGNFTVVNGTCQLTIQNISVITINQTNNSAPYKYYPFQFNFLNTIAEYSSNNSGIISVIILSIQMSPFSAVFIQFVSFWNICCLYSLINLSNSISLPLILKQIYNLVQTSLFQFLNINLDDYYLTNKNISSQYPNFYKVQYDVISSNAQNFAMIGLLVLFIIFTKILKNSVFSNIQFIKKVLSFSVFQAILGQFITFIPMSILPFKRFLKSSESLNSNQKLNNTLLIVLVFSFIILPFLMMLHYHEKQSKLSKKQKKLKNNQKQRQRQIKVKRNKFKRHITTKKSQFMLESKQKNILNNQIYLLYPQAEYKFLNCFVNLTVPAIVILPYSEPFFVISFIIYGYQVHAATKLSRYKIISIILSSLFLNFHLFYLICYLTNNFEIIFKFSTLICFGILILGGIIEILIVFGVCLYEILTYMKDFFKNPKISYSNKNKNQKKNNSKFRRVLNQKKKCVRIIDLQVADNSQIQVNNNSFQNNTTAPVRKLKKKITSKYINKLQSKQNETPGFKRTYGKSNTNYVIPAQNDYLKNIYKKILSCIAHHLTRYKKEGIWQKIIQKQHKKKMTL